jgi:hypothetical protein
MEMLIVALLASALTAVVTSLVWTRRARAQRWLLEGQLIDLKDRIQRSGLTLAAADVYAFEIPIGLRRVTPALEAGAEELAPVDFLSSPGEFMGRVHPDDVSMLEEELKTLTLRDGVRKFDYRFVGREGHDGAVHVVTRLVRDALGRPTLVSGVMLKRAVTARAGESAPEQASEEAAAPDSQDDEWHSFVSEHAASNAIDGEFVEAASSRVQRAV